MDSRKITYFYLLLTTSIWGSLYVVTRIALADIPPVTLLLFRYLFASLSLFIVIKAYRKKIQLAWSDIPYILFIGFVGCFVGVALQIWGTKYCGSSLASLVNSLNPVFISLFASFYLKEKINFRKVVSIIMGLIGVYLIVFNQKEVEIKVGVLFSILSVLFWSASSVVTKRMSKKYDSLLLTAFGIWLATVFCIPASCIELLKTPHYTLFSGQSIACVLYLGTIGTAVPNILWNKSLSRIDASICGLFYPIQPIVSIALGILLFRETMSIQFIAGTTIILIGLFIGLIQGSGKNRLAR